jgi:predicted RNA-binding Zn-ribbon protein involved in translation (DUF1610 family)
MTSSKRNALDRARALIADPSPEHLRYAALDLRMVMEMVTYDKLLAASDQLPPEVVRTWQPPQAIKALLEFQELADQSFSMSVADLPADGSVPSTAEAFEELDWLPVGEHHALTLAWLRKNYNKVGNLLHAPPPADTRELNLDKWSRDLTKIAAELELAIGSSIITMTERGGFVFSCAECGKPIVRSLEAMKRGATAVCPTTNCDAEYKLTQSEGGETKVIPLLVSFKCTGCDELIQIHRRKVAPGVRFACPACGVQHQVGQLQQAWTFGALPPQQA